MINLQTSTLIATLLVSGLNAGFYYAWQVSVIQGNKVVSNLTYLESMQSINRAILNPFFFAIFLGGVISLAWTTYQLDNSGTSFKWSMAAFIIYVVGVMGVTILGNVPLNEMLDAQNITQLSDQAMSDLRGRFEQRWNVLHLTRTVFAVLSFLAMTISALHYFQEIKN